MKQLLFLQTILVFFSHLAFSQDFCENQYSVPSELFRGRYEEPDMRKGHPLVSAPTQNLMLNIRYNTVYLQPF
jgi:hypothetical protein